MLVSFCAYGDVHMRWKLQTNKIKNVLPFKSTIKNLAEMSEQLRIAAQWMDLCDSNGSIKWIDEQLYLNNFWAAFFFLCNLKISYQLCCLLLNRNRHSHIIQIPFVSKHRNEFYQLITVLLNLWITVCDFRKARSPNCNCNYAHMW